MNAPRNIVIAGLVCAALAVAVSPFIFGVLGVAAGTIAVAKDAHWRGALVVTLSAVGWSVGYYWGWSEVSRPLMD